MTARLHDLRGNYGYRLRELEGGSAKYGPCEVCGGTTTTLCAQVEMIFSAAWHGGFWHAGQSLYGHRECLVTARKTEDVQP